MFGYTLRAQKDFRISWKKWILVSSMQVPVPGAQNSFWRFRFSWSVTKGFTFLRRCKNQFYMLLDMCIEHAQTKSVFTCQATKTVALTTRKSAKPALRCWLFLQKAKNPQLCCLLLMVHIALQERRAVTTKKKKHLHFWRNLSANHNQAHTNLSQKRQESIHLWRNCVDSPMCDAVNQNFNPILIL